MENPLLFNLSQQVLELTRQTPRLCHSRTSKFCPGCEPGQTFKCDCCTRLMPWCRGCWDEYLDICDDCWADRQNTKGMEEQA